MGLTCYSRVAPAQAQAQAQARGVRVRARALPDAYEPRVLPRYFETYIETICEYEPLQRACVENMVIPEAARQHEIVDRYEEMVRAFPMEDAPSLRYTTMKVLVQGDERVLEKLTALLRFYAQSVAMLTDAVQEISSHP